MTRLAILAAALVLVAGVGSAATWAILDGRLDTARAALAECRAYTATLREIDDALSDLPADPDAVRERLRDLARPRPR